MSAFPLRILPAAAFLVASLASAVARPSIDEGFRQPPESARPWVYWWWLNANVTEASITRDLEEMKAKGIAGLLMFDARGYHDNYVPPPPSRAEFMSPEWRRLLRHAVGEADRLGLKMSVNLSSCAGALKGPWEVGDDAPKELCHASVDVDGPGRIDRALPPAASGRCWDVAVVAARHAGAGPDAPVDEVVDVSSKVDASGRLVWDAPAGRWTIVRFACAIIEGHEHDADILSPSAIEAHFKRMGRAVLDDAGPLAGKTITHLYSVSWEGAIPTWTVGFEKYFLQYRGYDMKPFLPALAGMTVRTPEVTARFLRDYNRALADCFMHHCYGKLRDLAHAAGVQWHSESGGPWKRDLPTFKHADQLAFLGQNDIPQGEFWFPRHSHALNRPIAMAAHTYGRPIAAAEAFTHMTLHWSADPASLKPFGDAAFCQGINMFIWHTFSSSPPEFGKPGIDYFAGTHLNPNVTWWNDAGPFLEYLARCQFLLRQGQPVVDVLCYVGDEPYIHWGHAEKWSAKPALTLGPGRTYDLVNTEVLLTRLSVNGGRLALPEGIAYRTLVVDIENGEIPPEAMEKIAALAKSGATVILGRRPDRAPGLRDFPDCDERVRRAAGELWDAAAGAQTLGAGRVLAPKSLDETLDVMGIARDFEGPWNYTHRRTDDADIYFIAGTNAASAACAFRVDGRAPELWDPVSGRLGEPLRATTGDDGRTMVPIDLPENGSAFVVFRKPARDGVAAAADSGAQLAPQTVELSGPWEVRFAPGWGAPASIIFEKLIPWNEHPDANIRHFSGTATYRKAFSLDARQVELPVRLDLGRVKNIARVRLNGRDLGVVWTAPWTIDLSPAARPGENTLEIDVTNLWANRLIGDTALPVEKRLAKTNVPLKDGPRDFRPHEGYSSRDPLLPSGLMGPVRVVCGVGRETSDRKTR